MDREYFTITFPTDIKTKIYENKCEVFDWKHVAAIYFEKEMSTNTEHAKMGFCETQDLQTSVF